MPTYVSGFPAPRKPRGGIDTAKILEGLLGGVSTGLTGLASREAEQRKAERERQAALEQFRQRSAMNIMSDRIGTPQEISEATAFLSRPEPEQAMVDEFMRSIPSGVEPHLSPTFALAARGRDAATRLPQTDRELGNRPPARPRGGAPKNFTMEMNRALDTIRENLGPQGRYAPLSEQAVLGAAQALTVTLGRPLTPQEFAALKKAGKQASSSTPGR